MYNVTNLEELNERPNIINEHLQFPVSLTIRGTLLRYIISFHGQLVHVLLHDVYFSC